MAKEIARNYRQTAIKALPTFTIAADVGKRAVQSAQKSTLLVLNFLPYPSLPLLFLPPLSVSLPPHFGSACHIHHVVIGRSLMTTLHRITLACLQRRKETATRGKLRQAKCTLIATFAVVILFKSEINVYTELPNMTVWAAGVEIGGDYHIPCG